MKGLFFEIAFEVEGKMVKIFHAEGTKIVFIGDINQIDTPYLDAMSNGLFYISRLSLKMPSSVTSI